MDSGNDLPSRAARRDWERRNWPRWERFILKTPSGWQRVNYGIPFRTWTPRAKEETLTIIDALIADLTKENA